MKRFLLFSFIVISFGSQAQIVLERQVVGSYGQSSSLGGNIILAATVGEAVIATVSADSTTLTQGFHQSGFAGFLDFSIAFIDASCPTATDGSAVIEDLAGCRGPYRLLWSNGSTSNSAEDLGPGIYDLTVTTADCQLTKTFEVFSGPSSVCALRFFNAFSPNADGDNDFWEIENIENDEFADNTVEIYNRWGQLVWEGKGYDNTDVVWGGKQQKGEALADATYFYIVKVKEKTYKGYIELTR